jgi:glycerol-3-phosphate dehydrogenase
MKNSKPGTGLSKLFWRGVPNKSKSDKRKPLNRDNAIAALTTEKVWDIIVAGGGATGLGIAVDAAQRGFKVLLLEKNDFAKGTSSRSTKLVHGGVRYLAQGNIKLVVEALRERGYLLANAPHLTRVQHFIIPVYSFWDKWFYGMGLAIYDLLSNKLSLGRTKLMGRRSVLREMPFVRQKGLKGGIGYADGQFDDARLAITLALTAADQGAMLVNYMGVAGLFKENGKITGVLAQDEITDRQYELKARVVINATGVFVDSILDMDDSQSPAAVMPSQGVHIVVGRHFFPGKEALMIPKTRDGRVLFALPWHDAVVIGTTDTPLLEIREEPVALEEEIEFIIAQFNAYSEKKIDRADIKSVFAGLRPLVKTSNNGNTAMASRDHTIIVSVSNLITITGGKWTTYRKMAKDAVNNAAFVAKLPVVKCKTRKLRLHGAELPAGWDQRFAVYGTDAERILEMIAADPHLGEPLIPGFNYCGAEVVWSVQEEMAMTVEDILARRSRILLLDAQAAIGAAPAVAAIMAPLLGEGQEWIDNQIRLFQDLAAGYQIDLGNC